MASVFIKHGRYYARWKGADGKWRRQLTSCATKRDAMRFARDMEHNADRQRRGLEPLVTDAQVMTFAALYNWWWNEYGSKLASGSDAFWRQRLLPALGELMLPEVTSAKLEAALQAHVDELSGKSLNHLRGVVHTIFSKAVRRGLWAGANPAAAVERRKETRRVFDTLKADEVAALLQHLDAKWRALFAAAVWTGMRKGELLGLRKADVDLEQGTITVRVSYDSDTTKGRHAEVIPIAEPLLPYLRDAMGSSQSELVFPAADGIMRQRNTNLRAVLRRALARAGIVLGYDHVCRRQGCGHKERHADAASRRCPKCDMLLWPKALPRPLRFHDLRGTTATLLARAGVPLVVAQRILRHTDPRLTANVYSRVDLDDLRQGINRLGIPSLDETAEQARAVAGARAEQAHVPTVSPRASAALGSAAGISGFLRNDKEVKWSGRQDLNLRPLGPEPSALPG